MLASLVSNLLNFDYWVSNPLVLLMSLFQLWMFIDAIRRREWIWAFFIMVGFGISAMFYYFAVYRTGSSATRGFELPGAHHRRQIKDLQAKIHHLDKAHHHFQLGDIYFQQGKLIPAESCYRAALEREPQDIDTRAHLGQTLLRAKRPAEALPLLEGALECVRAGYIPGGLKANRDFAECVVNYEGGIPEEFKTMLFDPQTAGGLPIAVDAKQSAALKSAMLSAGVICADIGEIMPKRGPLITVTQ